MRPGTKAGVHSHQLANQRIPLGDRMGEVRQRYRPVASIELLSRLPASNVQRLATVVSG